LGDKVAVKFEGIPVFMDGQEWIVPALSVRQFRLHSKAIIETAQKLKDMDRENLSKDQMFMVQQVVFDQVGIVLDAFQRNYPDMTEDRLLDILDVNTFGQCLNAITNQSGIRAVRAGEKAPVATEKPTGNGSMAPSSQLPAGR
jgi:hypothetical protein